MENGNGVMYKIVIASAIMKQKTKQVCIQRDTNEAALDAV